MRASLVLVGLLGACSNAASPDTPDAMPRPDADTSVDASTDAVDTAPLDILRLNEVVASGTPDWIEVVNHTAAAVQMSDFCFTDTLTDFTTCKPFAAMSLAPGARFAQDIDTATAGFKLASDEEVWILRIADQRISDGVDWDEGDSPANSSFARLPDITGLFATTNQPTKGAVNLASDPNAPLRTLVINEVAAAETTDWVEVVNTTNAQVEASDYCYVDNSAAACFPFPAGTIAAGGYLAVDASDAISGFAYGSADSAIVKRVSDLHISDSVDWTAGQAGPAGSSYARHPDTTGAFANTSTQTRGAKNN
ncbi:MAG TPA: hypothetical protein VGM90_24250 [Kofleriaceae bacterium]|jgi:hypothetical protein